MCALKTSEIVLEKIKQQYLNGQLVEGERLPSERALAELFGVSRNSVREALQMLKMQDIIDIKRGGGSIIKESPATYGQLLTPSENEEHLIFEMLEVRRALEVEAAALAAQRASATDLKTMKDALDAMYLAGKDAAAGAKADVDFHLQIVAASRNNMLIQLVHTVIEQMEKTIYMTRQHRFAKQDRYEETLNEHKEIYLAIASGQSEEAKIQMEHHISKVRKELTENDFNY